VAWAEVALAEVASAEVASAEVALAEVALAVMALEAPVSVVARHLPAMMEAAIVLCQVANTQLHCGASEVRSLRYLARGSRAVVVVANRPDPSTL
jgi:hypothetical protein